MDKTEMSFLQQLEVSSPGTVQVFSLFSIPHEAFTSENEIFTSAIRSPQKCLATEKCIPDKRMNDANNRVNNFFIY
jgi:hypothetical protein